MNIQPLLKKCGSVVGLTATALLLLTTVLATGAVSQDREEYSAIRLHILGYFEPVEVDTATPVNEVSEPSSDSEVDEPSPDSEVDEPSPVSESDKPAPVNKEARLNAFEIKLRALNPTTCSGSSLWLEVEVTNTGREPVRIGRDEVWASFSYQLYRTDSDEVRGGATFFSGTSLDYFVLGVGESYRDTYEMSLKGKLFFRNVDKFALTTKIGSVKSNEVIFELCDCGNTEEEVK